MLGFGRWAGGKQGAAPDSEVGGSDAGARSRRRVGAFMSVVALIGLLGGSAAAASAASSQGVSSSAQQRPEAVTAAPRLPRGASTVGAVSASSSVSGAVALKLPDPTAVERFIAETSNPHSTLYHHYLARGQFAKRFGPSQATIALVKAQLQAEGLRVTSVSSNGILVGFSGAAARVESAFDTGLEQVRLADGSLGRATTSAIAVPRRIAPQVQAVLGLDDLVHDQSMIMSASRGRRLQHPAVAIRHASDGGPAACSGANAAYGGLTDDEVASAYGLDPLYSAGDLGAGQTVDIYELEPFALSDIQAFDQCYFGQDNTGNITVTDVDGGPGAGPGSAESALDIEDVSALAPDAKIHVFEGPNMNEQYGPLDTWNAIATADDASQISSSWGVCESALQQGAPGTQQVENEIFEQTAAQGQTVFSAAGDDGSDSCAAHASTAVAPDLSVLDPASQPYVTSVGGTDILDATDPPTETVWDNGTDGGAGGGGISSTWAMPSWQSAVAVPQTSSDEACSNDPSGTADNYHSAGIDTTLPSGTPCRETPDVSAEADPQSAITIYYDGQWTQIGGTSSATPLWAAMLAEMNASQSCASASIGFASPLLYQVAESSPSNYADAFNDITVGENDNLGVGGAVDYAAGTGYDMASGLGTPRVTDANGAPGLDQLLCGAAAAGAGVTGSAPQVAGLSPSSGSVSGGGTLIISGTNFGGAAGSVYFGTSRAHVVSWAPDSIKIDIPAYSPPPSTPAGSAGRALVTVATAGSQSSAPDSHSIYEYTANSSGRPVVDYVSAPNGPTGGGNVVDILGSGLAGATAVQFGDVAATIHGTPTANELQVTVPASDGKCAVPTAESGVCAVAVTVTAGGLTSLGPENGGAPILPAYTGPIVYEPDGAFQPACYTAATPTCEVIQAPEEYDYAPQPTISSVSPSFVSENGTSTAVITGSGFNLLTLEWVNVGPAGQEFSEDYDVEGISPTSMTVGIPSAGASVEPQSIPLSVQSAGMTSNVSSLDYAGTPTLSSISTHLVSQPDPGTLTITGTGLSDVDSVVFQGQGSLNFLSSTSTSISNQSDTKLTVQVPSFYAYSTDVLVCSVTGCSPPDPSVDTLTFAYPGRPVVTSISPSSGPKGTTVTIEGALDSEVTAVDFGQVPGTIVSEPELIPSGAITVTAPKGIPGRTVPITISTEGGQLVGQPTSAVTPAAEFTYTGGKPGGGRGASSKFAISSSKTESDGVIRLSVDAPQPGTFEAAAAATIPAGSTTQGRHAPRTIRYGRAVLTTSRTGAVVLLIKPSDAARAALAKDLRLRVRIVVTFKPKTGAANSRSLTVTVRR